MSNSIALLALEAADGTVVLTSITLVFAMLVALCLIITVEGKIFVYNVAKVVKVRTGEVNYAALQDVE